MRTPKLPKMTVTDEIKVITLVCCLLENLGKLTESQLLEIVTLDDIVPQFKLSDALTTIEGQNIAALSDGSYTITDEGKLWLNQFESSLAVTLRKKLLREGKEVVRLSELRKTARWSISQNDKGDWVFYAAFLNEMDGNPIMEIKIHSKTREGSAKAQEKFLKDPVKALSETIGNFI